MIFETYAWSNGVVDWKACISVCIRNWNLKYKFRIKICEKQVKNIWLFTYRWSHGCSQKDCWVIIVLQCYHISIKKDFWRMRENFCVCFWRTYAAEAPVKLVENWQI